MPPVVPQGIGTGGGIEPASSPSELFAIRENREYLCDQIIDLFFDVRHSRTVMRTN